MADARFALAQELLDRAAITHASPALVLEVGRRSGPIWQHATGHLTFDADAPAAALDTVFDLASLTKVVATTSLAMQAIATRRLDLDTRIASILRTWPDARVLVRHLLDHSSGLPAHARLWESARGREAYLRAITALPLDRDPGTASVYSDPGFMLLGFLLEALDGQALDVQFARLAHDLGIAIRFRPPDDWRPRLAPTEVDQWRGRMIVGEVHDENAAALEGVAGHAGLFGTVTDLGRFARVVLQTFVEDTRLGSPALMRTFAARTGVPGSSRALGWDTMLPTSSCGTLMSPTAIGHTGFTGTSLWVDHDRDLYIALLTNRVHPTRANDALVKLRPRIHDAVVTEMDQVRS